MRTWKERTRKLQLVLQNFGGNWFEVGNVRENTRKQGREEKRNTH
jgi:hypothetical protein